METANYFVECDLASKQMNFCFKNRKFSDCEVNKSVTLHDREVPRKLCTVISIWQLTTKERFAAHSHHTSQNNAFKQKENIYTRRRIDLRVNFLHEGRYKMRSNADILQMKAVA